MLVHKPSNWVFAFSSESFYLNILSHNPEEIKLFENMRGKKRKRRKDSVSPSSTIFSILPQTKINSWWLKVRNVVKRLNSLPNDKFQTGPN